MCGPHRSDLEQNGTLGFGALSPQVLPPQSDRFRRACYRAAPGAGGRRIPPEGRQGETTSSIDLGPPRPSRDVVKLKGFFQSAKASKIETRGTRYQYCDFLVKVGTVTMGPSARGISVEVRPRWTRADVVKGLALQIPVTLNAGRCVCLPDSCLQSSYASLPCIFYPFSNHLGTL